MLVVTYSLFFTIFYVSSQNLAVFKKYMIFLKKLHNSEAKKGMGTKAEMKCKSNKWSDSKDLKKCLTHSKLPMWGFSFLAHVLSLWLTPTC
jgi:hypothetical protein